MRRRCRPASSPMRRPVPSKVMMWSHQNSGKQASSCPASSGVRARRLPGRRTRSGSARRLGAGTLRTGLLSIAPSSTANWKIRRVSERHWPTVAGPTLAARSRCQRRTSAGPMRSIGAVTEPGPHVQPKPAFGDGQGVGAAVGIGGVQLPPLIGPAAERQPTAAAALPGAPSELQALLGGQVAGVVGGVHGLGALGAVVQPPGDLVALAALAPGHRAHLDLLLMSWTGHGPIREQSGYLYRGGAASTKASTPHETGPLAAVGTQLRLLIWPGTAGAVLVG